MVLFNELDEKYTDTQLDEMEAKLHRGFRNNIRDELTRIGRDVEGTELNMFFKQDGVEPEINLLSIDGNQVFITDVFGLTTSFIELIGSCSITTFYAGQILDGLRKIQTD